MNKIVAYILLLTFSFSALGFDKINFYHSDFRGNVVATTSQEGSVISRAQYSAYGELESSNTRFGRYFQGREYWPSDDIISVDRRFYSPEMAQFITTDKNTLRDGLGFLNPYQYAQGNPNAYIDKNGDVWQGLLAAFITILVIQNKVNNAGSATKTKDINIRKSQHPESAQHILDAQADGHPVTLTIDRAGASRNRRDSLKGVQTEQGKDRDEYPPAMFEEGGNGASVKLINSGDNRGSGASIGAQCRGLSCGTKVNINVVD